MNKNIKNMIYYLAYDNITGAKQCAKNFLANNNNKTDEVIKDELLKALNTVDMPEHLKGLIEIEYIDKEFFKDKFIHTEEDDEIIDKVIKAWNVSDKIQELKLNYLNTLLLYGVPGCGKTMIGRYLAYKTNLPFIYLNFGRLINKYLGETGKNLNKIFDYIKSNKCIVMIDELDAIGVERGMEEQSGEMSRIVISLMQCLDTVKNGSIIVGATNREDIIDKALKRRFTLKYEVKKPSKEAKYEIAKAFVNNIPNAKVNDSDIVRFVENIDTCADLTNELTIRVIECLCENEPLTL